MNTYRAIIEETPAYLLGEIQLQLEEDEITVLLEGLEALAARCPDAANSPAWIATYDKLRVLYDDYCIKYTITPALKAYNKKYGTWGHETEEEQNRWEGFRDAFNTFHRSSF